MRYKNPDGSPRYTFSHTEWVAALREEGHPDERIDVVINSFVHGGLLDVSMDEHGETWYTLKEEARAEQ